MPDLLAKIFFIKPTSISLVVVVISVLAFSAIIFRALSGIDPEWDTLAYHMPFAARLADICDTSCYQMRPLLESRFEGFPKLAHYFQGLIWRASSTPERADLLNIAGFLIFVSTAGWLLRLPVSLLIISLLAIPLVQIHLSTSYIDLFVNCMVMTSIAILTYLYLEKSYTWWKFFLPLIPLLFAANSKFQMLPVSFAIIFLTLCLFFFRIMNLSREDWVRFAAGFAVLSFLIFATPITNLLRFGNPIYPVEVQIAGMTLSGKESTISNASLSSHWEGEARPLVWLASIFEFRAYEGRTPTWTVDQGYVGKEAKSARMGGYFVPFVLANLLFFIVVLRNIRGANAKIFAGFFLAITLVTMFLPANHELRYYMYWIMSLVFINVILISRSDLAVSEEKMKEIQKYYSWVSLIAFFSVVLITGGVYLSRSESLASVLESRSLPILIRNGAINCMSHKYSPFTFLYVDIFRPGSDYTIREGADSAPDQGACDMTIN